MPLLERESALASLAEYAHEARAGDGRLVLVAGEAGVGKSTLVEALADRLGAELPGAHWAWGMCDGLFTPRPLGPLFDIAAELGGELLAATRSRAPREELFDALLRQVTPADLLDVLVLEDVHWADEATIDLLRFLARRLRNAAVLLVATYRDDALGPTDPLRIALGELGTQRSTRRIGLAPLSEQAVGILAGPSGLEPAELHRLTGGNPFFVTEVVRAGSAAVPASARDAVLARVAVLGDQARTVLDAGALVGTRIDPRLLAAVTGCPPEVLDELISSGLLVGDGAALRFRHELARLAVEQAVPAHRRSAIHAGILAALRESDSDDDAGMAFHAEAAEDGAAVLRYAVRAARRAAELASHREAAAQYQRALRFSGGRQPAELAELYDGLSYALSLLDRWQEAADTAQRARELWRAAGDRLHEGATLRQLSSAMCNLCRGDDAVAAMRAALITLEPLGPSAELAAAYAGMATQRSLGDRPGEAIDLAHRAQRIAASLGLHGVLSDALNTEGCALSYIDDENWTGPLIRALDIALTHRLPAQAGRAYNNLHGLLGVQRRFAEAEPYFVDGVAYCDEHDVTTYATFLRGERSTALVRSGRWDEAVRLARKLLDTTGASPINRIAALTSLGLVRARRGEDGVWPFLDEAADGADGSSEPQWIVHVRTARAEAAWLAGDTAAAVREAELADDVSTTAGQWMRGPAVLWLRLAGSNRPLGGALAQPYRRQLDGDFAGAAQRWLELDSPYDAALAMVESGDEALLRRAVVVLDDLGALATGRIARQRMRQHGVRSIPVGRRTTTRAHPLGLTRREHEVLDLVCAGHTNAEIAARLVISAKTVDHHVSAVLAKLGVPSRGQAAAAATRLGLAASQR